MKKTSRSRRSLLALAALLACGPVAPGVLGAEEEAGQTSAFRFRVDPVVLSPLFVQVDSGSSKFEEYRDMDSGMTIPVLRLFGESGDGNREFEFSALNISRADERYTMRYRNSGNVSILLDYNVIPHRFGNDAVLLFSNADQRALRISDAVQQSLQTQIETQFTANPAGINYAFLNGLLQPFLSTAQSIDLELGRERARARIDIRRLRPFSMSIDLKQETRQGNRPYGGSFGFSNVVEIPEPIDYRTTSADISGEWKWKRSGMSVGFRVSKFDNLIPTVAYDNPFRITDATDGSAYTAPGPGSIGGAVVGENALAPDNLAGDLYVNGRARLGEGGWIHGSARYGMMRQDDRLLAFTTNTAINPTTDPNIPFVTTDRSNLPEQNADSEVRITNVAVSGGSKLGSKVSWQGRYRYYDYDNRSSEIVFPGYVRFDAVWEAIPRVTVPYAWRRQQAGVEVGWDIVRSTRVAVSWDRERWDRDFREIEQSDEDVVKVTLNHRQNRFSLRGSLEHGRRTTNDYEVEAQELTFVSPTGINNQPTLRKFDEAERDYDGGSVMAIIAASDSISLTVGADFRNEDYDESEFGLVTNDRLTYSAELSYTPNEHISLFVFGHRTDAETFQRARQSGGTLSTNPADDWELTLDEITDTWGLGLDCHWAERWSGNLTGRWSDSNGDSDFFSPPGGSPNLAVGFNEYDDNEWLVASGRLAYAVRPNVVVGLSYAREEFTTNRFARDGLVPYMPGSLILNPVDGDYNADIVAVDLRMSF